MWVSKELLLLVGCVSAKNYVKLTKVRLMLFQSLTSGMSVCRFLENYAVLQMRSFDRLQS